MLHSFPEYLKLNAGENSPFSFIPEKFSPTLEDTGTFALSNVVHLHPSQAAFDGQSLVCSRTKTILYTQNQPLSSVRASVAP